MPCVAGRYAGAPQAVACAPCPPHTFSGAGAGACTLCPAGRADAATPGAPATGAAAEWAPCVGCPAGRYGDAARGACTACGGGAGALDACPGFLPAPLAPAGAACGAAAASRALPPFAPRALAPRATALPVVVGASVGGAAFALLGVGACASRASNLASGARGVVRVGRCLDLKAPAAALAPPAGRALFFAVLLAALAGLWAWLIASWALGSVVEEFSLAPATSVDGALPWAQPTGASPAALVPPAGAPLQLRISGQAALGCGAPLYLNYSAVSSIPGGGAWNASTPWLLWGGGGSSTDWQLAAPPGSCGGGGGAAFTLTCGACKLGSDSFVSFALPWTCQAFLLEALFVDASGAVGVVSADGAATSAAGGRLLAAVSWRLAPMLTVVEDATGGSGSAKGYRVGAERVDSSRVDPTRELPGGGVAPLGSAVVVTVALPLAAVAARTLLVSQESPAQIVAALVGVLSLLALGHAALRGKMGAAVAREAAGARAPAAAAGGGEARAPLAASSAGAALGTGKDALSEAPLTPRRRYAPAPLRLAAGPPPPPPPPPSTPARVRAAPLAPLFAQPPRTPPSPPAWGAANPLWSRIAAGAVASSGGQDDTLPPFSRALSHAPPPPPSPPRAPTPLPASAAFAAAEQPLPTGLSPQAPLPPGWTLRASRSSGRTFFYNKDTKQARWTIE